MKSIYGYFTLKLCAAEKHVRKSGPGMESLVHRKITNIHKLHMNWKIGLITTALT
jgi:hypothetical protein